MEKIRLGLIGVGGMGSHHLYYSRKNNKRIQIVALCDIIEERATGNITNAGLEGAKAYTDWKEMIDNEEQDQDQQQDQNKDQNEGDDQQQPPEQQDKQKKPEEQTEPEQMSRDNAKQILQAIEQDEKETQKRLNEMKAEERKQQAQENRRQNKDW